MPSGKIASIGNLAIDFLFVIKLGIFLEFVQQMRCVIRLLPFLHLLFFSLFEVTRLNNKVLFLMLNLITLRKASSPAFGDLFEIFH